MICPVYIQVFLLASVMMLPVGAQDADSLLRRINDRPDDTVKVYDLSALFETYLYSDAEKAAAFNQMAYELSEKLEFPRGKATALKHTGVMYQYNGKYDSARNYYRRAGEIYAGIPDRKQTGAILANIASSFYDQGNYDPALTYLDSARKMMLQPDDNMILAFLDNTQGSIYLYRGYYLLASEFKTRALKYYTSTGDRMRMADAEKDMGLIFSNLGDNQQALDAYRRAIQIYRERNDRMFLGEVYINYANTIAETGHPDSAINYLEQALELAKETEFLSINTSARESIGRLLHQQGNSQEGLKQLQQSLKMAQTIGDTYHQSSVLLNIATVNIDMGQYDRAEDVLEQSRILAVKGSYSVLLKNIHYQFYRLFDRRGLPGRALREHVQYTSLKDSLFKEQESRQLAEFEILYEMEKNRQQLMEQHASILLLQKENKIREQQSILLIVILGTVILLTLLLYYVFRSRNMRIRAENMARIKAQRQELQLQRQELEFKKRELASFALHLSQKNQLLDELKSDIDQLRQESGTIPAYYTLKSKVHHNSQIDRDWDLFKKHFEEVHPDFFSNLQSSFPQLSGNDMRLLALLKLNLSSKEIASILNITPESVKKSRYRLRKKLQLEDESNISKAINSLAN